MPFSRVVDTEDETDGRGSSSSGSLNHWMLDASSSVPSRPRAQEEIELAIAGGVVSTETRNDERDVVNLWAAVPRR